MECGGVIAQLGLARTVWIGAEGIERRRGRCQGHRPGTGRIGGLRERKEPSVAEACSGELRVDRAHEIRIEEWGFALEGQDPLRAQAAAAHFIKPLFEEPLGRADGVGAVDEQHIDAPIGSALDPADRILEDELRAWIVLGGGKLGKVAGAELAYGTVDLDLDHFPDTGVFERLRQGPPIPAAHDHDLFRSRMGPKRRVCQHFVIDEVVPLGQHDAAIDGHETAEISGLEDLDLLEGTHDLIELAPDPETDGAAGLWRGFHKPFGIIHHMGYLNRSRR